VTQTQVNHVHCKNQENFREGLFQKDGVFDVDFREEHAFEKIGSVTTCPRLTRAVGMTTDGVNSAVVKSKMSSLLGRK
jgi:hypothetical protein